MKSTSLILGVLAVALAGTAEAQGRRPFKASTPTGPVRATSPKPAPPPVHAPGATVFPVVYGFVPALVLSDGRIYADFGYGLEQVVRSCLNTTYVQPVVPTHGVSTNGVPVVAGNGVVLNGGRTQPPPMVQSASHQNLPSVQAANAAQRAASQQAQASCYRHDGRGGVVVVH